MTRFARGLKCARISSGAAKRFSLRSDARAKTPKPVLVRPKKCRRVINTACSHRRCMVILSAAGFGKQSIKTLSDLLRQILEEITIDQPHVDEIAEMYPVLIAVGQEFHEDQGGQGDDLRARFDSLSLVDGRRRQRILGTDFFASPYQVDGLA